MLQPATPPLISPTSDSINLLSDDKKLEYMQMKEEYRRKAKLVGVLYPICSLHYMYYMSELSSI